MESESQKYDKQNMLIYFLGGYGPIILFFLSIILLYSRKEGKKLLWIYGIVSILNVVLNIVLKLMIQLPRPMSEEDRKIFELAKDKGKIFPFNTYGMPSGHMQYCMFSLVFISYTLQSPWISLFYLIISIITMYHRVEYKYHTILQVIVGSIIGILVGYVTYLYSKRYITGEINKKEDDNAYFSN